MIDLFQLTACSLSDLLQLPDQQAAVELNDRMSAWVKLDSLQEGSFVERGRIIREFEARRLWSHLVDPETGQSFPSLTAWMSCSRFFGCRRTNFAAKKVMTMLADVPPERLAGVPTGTLYELTRLSTAVRNDSRILAAARVLPKDAFLEKVSREHVDQHVEPTETLRFSPVLSGAKLIKEWIEFALENDLAGNREEALVMACEAALREAKAEVPA